MSGGGGTAPADLVHDWVSRVLADTDTLMLIERLAVGVTLNSNDAAEGVAAFLEKREPVWTGS